MRGRRSVPGILCVVAVVGGCSSRGRSVPPPPAAEAEPPPGLSVSGFWSTWGEPLADILEGHRDRLGGRCRGDLAVIIRKSERRLVVACDGDPVKGYFIALGRTPEGGKERRGDGRTPEGEFYLWGKNPYSRFHLGLGVSYPDAEAADRGLASGLIDAATHRRILKALAARAEPPQDTPLGGSIFIHGGGIGEVLCRSDGKYARIRDWTEGCVALRNQDVEELFALLPAGTPIRIQP
ncbi:MAG: L,D-transpeptidase [Armatimonadetes bacterium]|nr:L,D-transpeptidase [Armatimonadota bacterium]